MAETIQTIDGELEIVVSDILQAVGYAPFAGIVRQEVPRSNPQHGELLAGKNTKLPFISISSPLPERHEEGAGKGVLQGWMRTVTVTMYASIDQVEGGLEPFRLVRQKVLSRLVAGDYRKAFTTASGCVFNATIRPKSRLDVSAWLSRNYYSSAFDVEFKTREMPWEAS